MPRRERVFTRAAAEREPDWSDPIVLRAAAKVELAQRRAAARYATDPWAFVAECVWTLDQITGQTRRVPEKPHLAYLTAVWAATRAGARITLPASTEWVFRAPQATLPLPPAFQFGPILPEAPLVQPLCAWPKSRRMLVTWLGVALNYWLARFRPGVKAALLSRKQGEKETEGSNELVWRAKFIHEHVPALLGERPIDYTTGRLAFADTQSELLGIAQGSDQLRQMTLTSIFADEMAFWEEAYETYVASRPTIEGGGRFTAVSSASPGFFKALVYDQMGQRAAP